MIRKLFVIILSFSQFLVAFGQKTHIVKQGETMETIAQLYQISIEELKKQNESAEILFPGLLLNIPQKVSKRESAKQEISMSKTTDIVYMRDGSYILCKVVGVRKSLLSIRQDESKEDIKLPVKDVLEINYADGSKKKYGKR